MKKLIAVVALSLFSTAFAVAGTSHASLVPVRKSHHHATKHHAHKAAKHHIPKRNRHTI